MNKEEKENEVLTEEEEFDLSRRFCIWVVDPFARPGGKTIDPRRLSHTDYLNRVCRKKISTNDIKGMDDAKTAQKIARERGARTGEVVAFFPMSSDGRMISGIAFQPQITVLEEKDGR